MNFEEAWAYKWTTHHCIYGETRYDEINGKPALIFETLKERDAAIKIISNAEPKGEEKNLYKLFAWRVPKGKTTKEELNESLSVEGLPYEDIPNEYWPAVTAFRHRRQGERLRIIEKWLRTGRSLDG